MIIGNPAVFALESRITEAYERLSFLALGFFVIHIAGHRYGIYSPESTMLACSFDKVKRRITDRGTHVAPFAGEEDAGKIADAIQKTVFAEQPSQNYFGLTAAELCDLIYANHLIWAPDGDQAFDDGSYVLHFDIGQRIRLIGFKSKENYVHDPTTLSDAWLAAEDFYRVLKEWDNAFEAEWLSLPKMPH